LPPGLEFEVRVDAGDDAPLYFRVPGDRLLVPTSRPGLERIAALPSGSLLRWQVGVVDGTGACLHRTEAVTCTLARSAHAELERILILRGIRTPVETFRDTAFRALLDELAGEFCRCYTGHVRARFAEIEARIKSHNDREPDPRNRVGQITWGKVARLLGVVHSTITRGWLDHCAAQLHDFIRLLSVLGLRLPELPAPDGEPALCSGYLGALRDILLQFGEAGATPPPPVTLGAVRDLRRGEFDDADPAHLDAYEALLCVIDLTEVLDPLQPGPFD
jgi:hypothetical protein